VLTRSSNVQETSGALQTAIKAVRRVERRSDRGLHTKPASIEPMGLVQREITYMGTWCYPVPAGHESST